MIHASGHVQKFSLEGGCTLDFVGTKEGTINCLGAPFLTNDFNWILVSPEHFLLSSFLMDRASSRVPKIP